jgi:hypothetical protein
MSPKKKLPGTWRELSETLRVPQKSRVIDLLLALVEKQQKNPSQILFQGEWFSPWKAFVDFALGEIRRSPNKRNSNLVRDMAQCLYQLNGIQQEFENSEVFGFMLSSKSNHLVRWCISVSWFTYEWQIEYVAHHKDLMEFIFAVSRKRQIAIVDQMTPVLPQTVILCELLPFFSKQFFC